MIHSLAGGSIGKEVYVDIVFVEILEGTNKGVKSYYKAIKNLYKNDIVIVSYGLENLKAKVLRVDKNVSSFVCPIPIKKLKEVIKKV